MSKPLDPIEIHTKFIKKMSKLSKDHPLQQEVDRVKARIAQTQRDARLVGKK